MTRSYRVSLVVVSVLGCSLVSGAAFARNTSNTPALGSEVLPANSTVVEDVVARVNDRIITNSDYRRAEQQLEQSDLREGMSPDEVEAQKKNLLRDLIDQQLLLSKGKELGISGDTGMIKRLDEIRKANHLKTMEDLEKAAEAQHVSFEDFKASIRNNVITQRVVQQEVSPHIAISPQEVRAYYQEHEDQFAQPESIEMSEILIPTPDNPTSAELAEARSKADGVEAKLKNGANFANLAKAESSGPTAAEGGALGQFRHGMMAPELEAKTFDLKAGQFTEPIRTKQGYVILEVTEHTAAGVEPFEKVRPQVEEAVFMQKMQPALRNYLTKLREQAYIDVKPGFVDTGASPNEIQMSYSAYTEPGHKKKKEQFHRVRFRGRQRNRAKAVAEASGTTATKQPSARKQKRAEEAEAKLEQKPGKKEKIRFGQAPRETLPPATADVQNSTVAQNTPASANPDIHYVNPDGESASGSAPRVKKKKTRFGAGDRFHFHHTAKKVKVEEQPLVPPPTPVELETRKVQDQPLGLGDHVTTNEKKKEKGKKTRLAREQPKPETIQQPYMGNQQPVPPPASGQASQPSNGQPQ